MVLKKKLKESPLIGAKEPIFPIEGLMRIYYLPEQFFPSPVKPLRQKQEWLPTVLTHLANSLQSC